MTLKFQISRSCSKKRRKNVRIENACTESPETDDTTSDDEGGAVKFNRKFTCLGYVINFVLDDTVDAQSRVLKDSKAMDAQRFI